VGLAVAGGIALAPYWWWLVGLAALGTLVHYVWRRPELLLGPYAAALVAWPIWLWQRGSPGEALFVVALYVVLIVWQLIAQRRLRITNGAGVGR
jgi:hypothetical protein